MKLPRRKFLHLAAAATALPAVPRFAWPQSYPTRPVRLIVPVGPAGATDITARLVGQWLSKRLGQQFIIENRPGAGSNIGTEAVVRAPADGYMLLMVGPSNAILLSGQVQLYFGTTASSLEYVRAGKLRALAVTIERRLDELPDIPAVAEFVPGYEASNWWGIAAPKAAPAEIVAKLNQEINAAFADSKIKARLTELGGTPLAGPPAEFGKLIADETEKWGKVIRAAGIKVE
jgi:tripartite-type tricarboxylate transporter receptor subunit TctC